MGHVETHNGRGLPDALPESIDRYVPMAVTRADRLSRADLDTGYPSENVLHVDLGEQAEITPATAKRDPAEDLLRVVRESPGIGLTQFAETLGRRRPRVLSLIRDLQKQGALSEGPPEERIDPTYYLPSERDRK